ncbi:MAG: hypothetical protein SV186_05210 [Candidatus Nanohaloarchaea archaeon]|nr:hypothetical protein [Candidatus Nanohaloarchaea archaeon]
MTHVSIVPYRSDMIVCAAPDQEEACDLGAAVAGHLGAGDSHDFAVDDHRLGSRYGLDDRYRNQLANPADSMNYHLWQGCADDAVIDWWTHTTDETRTTVTEELFCRLREEDCLDDIGQKDDIETVLETRFPTIHPHGLDELLQDTIWTWIKNNRQDQLNDASKRALQNGKNGKAFEQFFEQVCDQLGLTYYDRPHRAFARHLPNVCETVRNDQDGLSGLPDYLIDKQNPTTLTEFLPGLNRRWEPNNRYAFVEVKYNTSRLSQEQQAMASALKKHDVTTWIFKGTRNNTSFHQVE